MPGRIFYVYNVVQIGCDLGNTEKIICCLFSFLISLLKTLLKPKSTNIGKFFA